MKDAEERGGGLQSPSPLTIVSIVKSEKKGKKLCAVLSDGKRVDFGSDVSTTFAEGATEQKRNAYWKRHLGNPVEREKIENLVMSPALLSAYVLWFTPDLRKNVETLNGLLAQKVPGK